MCNRDILFHTCTCLYTAHCMYTCITLLLAGWYYDDDHGKNVCVRRLRSTLEKIFPSIPILTTKFYGLVLCCVVWCCVFVFFVRSLGCSLFFFLWQDSRRKRKRENGTYTIDAFICVYLYTWGRKRKEALMKRSHTFCSKSVDEHVTSIVIYLSYCYSCCYHHRPREVELGRPDIHGIIFQFDCLL